MAHTNIRDLVVGKGLTEFFMVKSKRTSTTRQGKPFLDLTLQDGSGTIEAKIWEDAEVYDGKFARGDVVKIQADVDEWQGNKQLKIKRLRKAEESDDFSMSDLIPSSQNDVGQMLGYVQQVIVDLSNPHLKALLQVMFEDQQFVESFSRSTAARDLHHVYLGGLLEHTVNMLKVAEFVLEEIYPTLDRNLVLTGVILHDVGKTRELDSSNEFSYTREGYLVGHIFIGAHLLNRYAGMVPDFPEDLLTALLHIILSHHGEREWGAAILPMTPEAMLIHLLDNLDAKTNMVLRAIETDPNTSEEFTKYHNTLKRHFFKGRSSGAVNRSPSKEPEPDTES